MAFFLNSEKNIGLTEEEYSKMVNELKEGNESLFEKMFVFFFNKNVRILQGRYRANHEDAYDCVMWALLRIRQMILEGKITYGNLNNYFTRMAVTRYIKTQSRKKEFATETIPEPPILDEPVFDTETISTLERAWAKLGAPCKQLLKGYYYDKIELKTLTKILDDSSTSNTRKRKERCLKKLRALFFESAID